MPSLIAEICEFGSCPYDAQALFSAIDPAHPSPPFGVPHANTACSGNVCAYPSLRRRQLLLHLKQRFEWSHGLIFLSAVCRGQAHRSSRRGFGLRISRAVCNHRASCLQLSRPFGILRRQALSLKEEGRRFRTSPFPQQGNFPPGVVSWPWAG